MEEMWVLLGLRQGDIGEGDITGLPVAAGIEICGFALALISNPFPFVPEEDKLDDVVI